MITVQHTLSIFLLNNLTVVNHVLTILFFHFVGSYFVGALLQKLRGTTLVSRNSQQENFNIVFRKL